MLYFPENAPANGQKGLTVDNVFLPVSGEIPSTGQKGLLIHDAGKKMFLPLKEKNGIPETDQKGFLISSSSGAFFVAEIRENLIPSSGLVFYLSCMADATNAETGQYLNKSGTISAVSFQGRSAYYMNMVGIQMDNIFPLGAFSFSLSMWVSFPVIDVTNIPGWVFLCGFGVRSSSIYGVNNDFGLMSDSNSALRFKCGYDSGGSKILSSALEPNLWYHIAMTYDNDSKLQKAYLNGSLVSEHSVSSMNNELTHLFINMTSEELEKSNVYLSKIRVYNTPLDANDIATLAAEQG